MHSNLLVSVSYLHKPTGGISFGIEPLTEKGCQFDKLSPTRHVINELAQILAVTDHEFVANFWDYRCISVAAEFLRLYKFCVLHRTFVAFLLDLNGLLVRLCELLVTVLVQTASVQ